MTPPSTSNASSARIAAAIRAMIADGERDDLAAAIEHLTQLIVGLKGGEYTRAEVEAALAGADLAPLKDSLGERTLEVAGVSLNFAGAEVAGAVQLGDIAGRDVIKPTFTLSPARRSPADERERLNRTKLIGQVRQVWLENVLYESLYERVRFELGMKTRQDAIDHPWRKIIRTAGAPPQELQPGLPIAAAFAAARERLLILGAPGSGKTTTLLSLAEALLDLAAADEALPVPVVFQLSTWAVQQPPLDKWLTEELNQRYKVPGKVAAAWLGEGMILPLLDGLDEVGPEDTERAACIRAINQFLRDSGGPVAVCSRTVEYERQDAELGLDVAVELQPLTSEQVDSYLEQLGPPLGGLKAAVAADETLRDLSTSPLLLNVMVLSYRGTPAAELVGQERESATQGLWANFVRRRLETPRADAPTEPEQLRAWLCWLARGMLAHGQQVFYIEYLQPSWLATREQRRAFHTLTRTVIGIVCGLVTGLVVGLGGGQMSGWAGGLLSGLGAGGVASFFAARGGITTVEHITWSWRSLLDIRRFAVTWVGTLIANIGFGMFALLLNSFINGFSAAMVITMLIFVVFLATLTSLFLTVYETSDVPLTVQPNEGIQQSLRNILIGSFLLGSTGALIGVIGSVIGMLAGGLGGAFLGGVCGGVSVAIWIFGGEAVLQHGILRRMLHQRCGAPQDFAATLDEAVARTLMTRVGGGYRFYHRLLQEHFATDERSALPVAPILGPSEGDRTGGARSA
jgi:energy-coupling factor transporter ATP-binding protein EcfA2